LNYRTTFPLWIVALVFAAAAWTTSAAAFEGEIRARFIHVSPDTYQRLTGGDSKKAFDIPVEDWMAEVGSGVQMIESRMQVKKNRIRVDGMDPRDPDSFMIVDVEKGITWAVMPARKTIMKFTAEGAKQLAEAAEEMQKQLEEHLREKLDSGDVPPEQREVMEKILARAETERESDVNSRPRPTVKKSGRSADIHGVKAEEWEISDGPRSGRAWITTEHTDLAILYSKLQKQMAEMRPNGSDSNTLNELIGKHGFGVRMQLLDTSLPDGDRYSINDVYETKAIQIPEGRMELPADYQVMTPDEMLKQHRQSPGVAGP
jgi:hypothetical protein